jgi:hypothetical protein
VHETGIGMIADYVLQDGKRLGTRRVTSLDTAFVDSLFAKLLHKEVNGEKGRAKNNLQSRIQNGAQRVEHDLARQPWRISAEESVREDGIDRR